MKIIIQSFGDIITNSSTETFCISNGSTSDLQLLIDTILKVYGITNSSSELFCTITSEKHLKEIYEILDSIVGYRQEPEIDVCIDYCSKSNIEESELKSQFYKELPDKWIEVDYPYCKNSVKEFYISGFEGILNKKIGKANYKIRYYLGD